MKLQFSGINLDKFKYYNPGKTFNLVVASIFLGLNTYGQFVGVELAAGWSNDSISIEFSKYVSSKEAIDQKVTIDVYAKESQILYKSISLNVLKIEKLEDDMNNPCQSSSNKVFYKASYSGIIDADGPEYDYQIRWTSKPLSLSFTSSNSVNNKLLVLNCELSSKIQYKQQTGISTFQNPPPFILCTDISYANQLLVKSNKPQIYNLITIPIQTVDVQESNLLPPSGNIPNTDPSSIPWKKGFSYTQPFGINGYEKNQELKSTIYSPKKIGTFIISEGLSTNYSDLTSTVRTFIITISK